MLEEIKYDYKVTKINIFKDEQFKPEFKKLSPFNKIPVIIDHEAKINLFESGAILIYLGEKRYFKISKRIYQELDDRLSQTKFLAGENYTIADIATFPWIARHEWHDIGLKKFNNLTRWYNKISKREAVQRGYDLLEKGEKIPKV